MPSEQSIQGKGPSAGVEQSRPALSFRSGGERAPGSLADWTTRRLREAILVGQLAPGHPLRTVETAELLEVSHTPLREALQRLAGEGLVVIENNRGARVAGLSVTEIHEVNDLRLLLEPVALERSMQNGDEHWRAAVNRAHERLQRSFEEHDLIDKEESHRAFHRALMSRCGSRSLLRIVESLADQSARYRMLAWRPEEHDVFHNHDDLFEACLSGDVELAKCRCIEHIEHLVELQIETLKRQGLLEA
jgi:GntR family carbon starvation induced transcriptional regulator